MAKEICTNFQGDQIDKQDDSTIPTISSVDAETAGESQPGPIGATNHHPELILYQKLESLSENINTVQEQDGNVDSVQIPFNSRSSGELFDPRVEERIIMLSDAATMLNHLQSEMHAFKLHTQNTETCVASNIESFGRGLGACVQKSAPYYEMLERLRLAEAGLHQAAFEYVRAQSKLKFSKEKMNRLEEGLIRLGATEDVNVMLALNAVTGQYVENQQDAARKRKEHSRASEEYVAILEGVTRLKTYWKADIEKSRPYYDFRHRMKCVLEEDRLHMMQLEAAITHAKEMHEKASRELEEISQQIHDRRLLARAKTSGDCT
ncbi:putative SH3 domain-binding protein 5-like [Hypsibius exemplaris]|uniref:SH3 domain-binding protein 5-like n=1 Tax=Hypsibius exemplaris TaxID=2072580 RepID=A0A1W0WLC2_HYPEX|nr:putative SH3 domain-binding protein 5-like [Hypsibius exemplaris]